MRVFALILVLAVSPAFAGDGPPQVLLPAGTDLADNPGLDREKDGFAEGWAGYRSPSGMQLHYGPHGIDGAKGVRFTPPPNGGRPVKPSGISRTLTEFPRGKTIEVTAVLRVADFRGTLVVWARCDGESGGQQRAGAFQNSKMAGYDLSGTSLWSPVTVRVTPDAGTKQVVIGVLAGGTGTVDVHAIYARGPGEAVPPPTPGPGPRATGPGLYRAEGRYLVMCAKDGASVRVLFPVPILWRDQVPLDFRVWTEPTDHVESVRIHETKLGFHYAEVKLSKLPKGNDSVSFHWAGNVLVLPHRPSAIPKGVAVPFTKVPADVKPWLAGTWCCDTADPEIRKVAAEIRRVGATADLVVPETLRRMKAIFRGAKSRVSNLTASEALTKEGSCTSCANLGAALLRANGIPARIIAGYPTWSGPLQTHYVVEYWLPDGGWRLMESTMCRDDRPGWEQIEVAMVSPGDEAEKLAGRRFSAAGGVPWLSLTEYPDAARSGSGRLANLVRLAGDMPDKKYCDHRAVTLAVFPKTKDEDWAKAAATLAARWRNVTAKALKDATAIEGMAPRPGTKDAKSLVALLESLR